MTKQAADHIIALDKFSIGHQKGEPLLQNINLSINRGEMVALIGRNGSDSWFCSPLPTAIVRNRLRASSTGIA